MFKNCMFRDIFSSGSLLAGLVFFLLCVGSSFLYNWHVRRTTQDELAQSDVLLQHRKSKNKTRSAADAVDTSPVDFEQVETPLETDNTQESVDRPALPSNVFRFLFIVTTLCLVLVNYTSVQSSPSNTGAQGISDFDYKYLRF